jgi:hypothetical protein
VAPHSILAAFLHTRSGTAEQLAHATHTVPTGYNRKLSGSQDTQLHHDCVTYLWAFQESPSRPTMELAITSKLWCSPRDACRGAELAAHEKWVETVQQAAPPRPITLLCIHVPFSGPCCLLEASSAF